MADLFMAILAALCAYYLLTGGAKLNRQRRRRNRASSFVQASHVKVRSGG